MRWLRRRVGAGTPVRDRRVEGRSADGRRRAGITGRTPPRIARQAAAGGWVRSALVPPRVVGRRAPRPRSAAAGTAARLAQVEAGGGSGALSVLHGRLVLTRSPPPLAGPSPGVGCGLA